MENIPGFEPAAHRVKKSHDAGNSRSNYRHHGKIIRKIQISSRKSQKTWIFRRVVQKNFPAAQVRFSRH